MSWQETLTPAERQQLVKWARSAVHGLDQSTIFVGILDDRPLDAARIEFTLQLGHAILTDKLIVLPAPHGVELPKKLAAIADVVVRYDAANPQSLQPALVKALTELGVNKQ